MASEAGNTALLAWLVSGATSRAGVALVSLLSRPRSLTRHPSRPGTPCKHLSPALASSRTPSVPEQAARHPLRQGAGCQGGNRLAALQGPPDSHKPVARQPERLLPSLRPQQTGEPFPVLFGPGYQGNRQRLSEVPSVAKETPTGSDRRLGVQRDGGHSLPWWESPSPTETQPNETTNANRNALVRTGPGTYLWEAEAPFSRLSLLTRGYSWPGTVCSAFCFLSEPEPTRPNRNSQCQPPMPTAMATGYPSSSGFLARGKQLSSSLRPLVPGEPPETLGSAFCGQGGTRETRAACRLRTVPC